MCCRNRDGLCTPFMTPEEKYLFLRKGKPCTVGFCDGAVSALLVSNHSLTNQTNLTVFTAMMSHTGLIFYPRGNA